LADGSGDGPAGYRLVTFDQLDSTNEEACRQARAGAPAGTVIVATRQTAGRGRRGRVWQSPAGNLYFSVLLRPSWPLARSPQLSFLAALAMGEAVIRTAPDAAKGLRYKWPNDILLDGAKLCGILLESASVGQVPDWMVIGVGLNIASCPENTPYPATALAAMGVSPAPLALLGEFLQSFDDWLACWKGQGFAPLRTAWLARAAGLDKPVTVRLEGQELAGVMRGLDESGALLLDAGDGTRHLVSAGDVFFPRKG
jgi:BirA family biotin operon repressor/biotin-[acetyl-CoA-carboxylase] ligase